MVAGASVRTGSYRDWTAKLTVDGLQPATTYWYRFIAPDGSFSPVGRTRTLPVGEVASFRLGLFSCSNLPVGWFNAYAHAAGREDMDLWLHVGDYLYEYGLASYKPQDRVAGREGLPAHAASIRLRLDGGAGGYRTLTLRIRALVVACVTGAATRANNRDDSEQHDDVENP